MTLEQFNYLAQIIGVILVVVSLIYLAQQLRQNTEMARVAAGSQQVQRDFDITESFIANRELAEVWVKGGSDFGALDTVDQERMVFFERRAIIWWHHTFQLHRRGLFTESEWKAQIGIIRAVGNRSSVRAAWGRFREGFDKPFQDFVDEQFEVAGVQAPISGATPG